MVKHSTDNRKTTGSSPVPATNFRRFEMGNKIIRVEVVAELTVPEEFYEGMSNAEIASLEEENYQEWILENIKSDEITVKDEK